MRWDADSSPAKNARSVLPKKARRWFEAGQQAAKVESYSEKVHAFRLKTKHFRYTLELFRPLYGKSLERRLDLLKDLQSVLGDWNDCAVAGTHIGRTMKKGPSRDAVERYLAARVRRCKARFLRLWKEAFGGPRECERWARYLAGAKETGRG